ACEGQKISIKITPESNFDVELVDYEATQIAVSENTGTTAESIDYTVEVTEKYFMHIYTGDGAGKGSYTMDVSLVGQNDAGSGKDAGNTIGTAMSISSGSYFGYLDAYDWEDWYSFNANTGQGIKVTLECPSKTDFDVHLYNPSGEWVHSAQYYGDDTLEYPADASGTWKIKLDIFPGWDASKWPDNYFLYGSGPYEMELSIGVSVPAPPGPIPQPDITPVAQTFVVNNDKNSNADEYGYLAAIPAANYIDGGKRYVSPIVYRGCDYVPTWFTTVDDTTQYLIDDWNAYLARHGVTATEYVIDPDPIKAAANIATSRWSSSTTAVVAVDGSSFEDTVTDIFDQDATISSLPDITRVQPGSSKFKDVGGNKAVPMFIGQKWGAIHLVTLGDNFGGDTGLITPRYEAVMEDWWPYPYDFKGPDMDTFYPVILPGFWAPYITSDSGLEEFQIIKYAGDRYKIPIDNTDSTIKVTITTDEPSNLIVYLIDPYGNVRRPSVPHYNGGEINPIHIWNGGHWLHDYDEFRTWIVEPHTEYSVEVNYPMEGKWTAIVVPYLDHEQGDIGYSGSYHITAEVREHNPDRTSAALSAANGAVIASLNHAPLLYVTKDTVPSETSDALSTLGVSNVIFVNINGVSSASISGATEYTTMQEVVDAIKADANSENFITITSLATGDGYFAPAAMAAAYHGSPVLNIGEAAGAYDTLDKLRTWCEYNGDFYHGSRSLGHPPNMGKPFDLMEAIKDFIQNQNLPPIGFDLEKRWPSAIHDGIYGNLTAKYGLDLGGKEAYLFVADRDTDIRDFATRIMTGNNSYAGHIPGATAAFSSAHIVRCILYPAIMYANPGRDVTTTQLMNFPDGRTWTTNDGKTTPAYSSQAFKEAFSSHGRFYEGHCVWDGLLERFNKGVSVWYYSGHGTGGSGISCQYKNVEEAFPYVQLKHENLKDFNWPDAWRGYMYDDKQTKSARWGGFTWYNAKEPNLYDLIHFKWVDQLLGNVHCIWDLWMSCTTQAHLGPIVMLSHGGTICYGNIWSGLCPMSDLIDDYWTHDVFVNGDSIGEAFSRYLWLFERDHTTDDPTAMYGSSSLTGDGGQVVFGDPTMTCYSPEWTEPVPVMP
ncbi:MAG: PPC domain-containing protein, partial [Candidatus Thermoplasmatota archaeon]|nr:PPC domain-containing protein [Candidatus Thermoplasmatota archaeon]